MILDSDSSAGDVTDRHRLIATMLGRLEMDVDECIAAYTNLMKRIFEKQPKRNPIKGLFGSIEPRFDANTLEDAIKEVITNSGPDPTDCFYDQTKCGCRV